MEHVLKEMEAYWGGMLDLGATTFWEEYDPTKTGAEHYAMYGEPYDKSLCHAWGASPIYVLGRYFLGVRPLSPGYETFEVRPELGGLSWIRGTVPTPGGEIQVSMDSDTIRVRATAGRGVLRFRSAETPRVSAGEVRRVGEEEYEVELGETGEEYVITKIGNIEHSTLNIQP
jgi:hypothetical protein